MEWHLHSVLSCDCACLPTTHHTTPHHRLHMSPTAHVTSLTAYILDTYPPAHDALCYDAFFLVQLVDSDHPGHFNALSSLRLSPRPYSTSSRPFLPFSNSHQPHNLTHSPLIYITPGSSPRATEINVHALREVLPVPHRPHGTHR